MNRIRNFLLACTFTIVFSDSARSMYDPHIGRFCSKDPIGFQSGPSAYEASFVGKDVDPTGLLKCKCDDFLDAIGELFGNPLSVEGPVEKEGQDPRRCNVRVYCDGDCPSPAYANPVDADGNIDICITTRGVSDYEDFWVLFEHEWQHAKDFCVYTPKVYRNFCTRCVKLETAAHEVSCRLSFAEGTVEYGDCVKCGVWKSCRKPCPTKRRPSGCKWSAVGTPGIDPAIWPF
jgi:hypothetical protein